MQTLGLPSLAYTYFAISFIISFVLCVGIIFLTKYFKIFMDSGTSHKPQRFHTRATPRAGGIGIFVAFCVMCAHLYDESAIIILGCGVIFASGLIEDFSGQLSPKVRLVMQCIAAFGLCALLDVMLRDLSIGVMLPYVIALCFSTFALVGVSNAINIIDGFNGLASGVCMLVLAGIVYVAYDVGDMQIYYCALAILGAILGFFVCNFPFGRIFLGDGGAYFLGFILGFLLMCLTQRHSEAVSAFFGLSIMIYPIYEVVFSIWRRKRFGANATKPDSLHLHTLIFRVLKRNAMTSSTLLMLYMPFVCFSIIFYANTGALMCEIAVFTLLYTLVYKQLKAKTH
ncbi:undecaprenyl/decaprenyl-phosphate alpha-N-acetylglucosaminyl 1-phosphate transferase [Helicobacter jaachi]|uniref:Undecaprenyl/decaprenyl-phosphate alpha-N-acetylglucosaminyl 1-phosphate transferase n=1 Tax=Helicobacter jaachi TaxID=1677920 RepID=A0A4U8TBV4_9HELI|nr:MraY family glycosyltransferase [Helicobacter jaachi]TLD97395.1 undecaprenyl/decaprenyl-phosphate alpha-N-acetylglucosaminyl 1-phosphate transferase [Helicobacter jaachi]